MRNRSSSFLLSFLVLVFATNRLCASSSSGVSPAERKLIEKAVPKRPFVKPKKRRNLLIFEGNVGYPGHPSAARASYAFKLMGKITRAFTAWVSSDPKVFRAERLKAFDAVVFNNTVGNLFTDKKLRQNLVDFVYSGGGLGGIHGTSVAFTKWPGAYEDWPEFGIMLGARGARHRESRELVTIKVEDPENPIVQVFPKKIFTYRDEFFRFHGPYSRKRVRVLLSIDTERTNVGPRGPWKPERADNDYALSWIRSYGRGRVFYCTIGHNPYVFWDPLILRFYLAAFQFLLGDLKAPTTPSAFLSKTVRAQEKLQWQFALESSNASLSSLIEKAQKAGFLFVEATTEHITGSEQKKAFDFKISTEERESLRLKLDMHSLRLLVLRAKHLPYDRDSLKRLFAFARLLGADLLIFNTQPRNLKTLEGLCKGYDLNVAFDPEEDLMEGENYKFLSLCRSYDNRMGFCLRLNSNPPALEKLSPFLLRLKALRFSKDLTISPQTAFYLSRLLEKLKEEKIRPLVLLFPDSSELLKFVEKWITKRA